MANYSKASKFQMIFCKIFTFSTFQFQVITEQMEAVWSLMDGMKKDIIKVINSDNDGMRTHAIKFMEMLVIVQTHQEDTGKDNANFSLDDVPMTLKLIRRRKLEEEARDVFDKLIEFHGSAHISR